LGLRWRRDRAGGSNHEHRPTRTRASTNPNPNANAGRSAKADTDHEDDEPCHNPSPVAPPGQTFGGALRRMMFAHYGQ